MRLKSGKLLLFLASMYLCCACVQEPDPQFDSKFLLLKLGMTPTECIKIMGEDPILRESASISVAGVDKYIWRKRNATYTARFVCGRLAIRERTVKQTKMFY